MNSCDEVLNDLTTRGWCFRDENQIKGLIQIRISMNQEGHTIVASVESELLNMDLRNIGGKSLPEHSSSKRVSHFQGPKVLQVVSARDIYQSSVDSSIISLSSQRRLLRLGLTDGHSEITAIEYSPIPSIDEDIFPGTKVCVDNKPKIHSGILCLDAKVMTVLGGLVQSLYEEWKMNKKYTGFSRCSLKLVQSSDGDGPPPFEKLQCDAHSHYFAKRKDFSQSRLQDKLTDAQSQAYENLNSNKIDGDEKIEPPTRSEDKASSSVSRPKEVVEVVPIQNQAAAQKLLHKMTQSTQRGKQFRDPKYRDKGRKEEPALFTLDEWESKTNNASTQVPMADNISYDEQLAWQLQSQLDLEDCYMMKILRTFGWRYKNLHSKTIKLKMDISLKMLMGHEAEAEKIQMSLFKFDRGEEKGADNRSLSRGRGGGRGRGKMRGRKKFS